ncbi:MAG: PDDEXK nuclease domain-containing protein [Proteobacteria bacterium]|nr:PDDEXK nuclease domain-containing protein [Pseudomonadota bacterium]
MEGLINIEGEGYIKVFSELKDKIKKAQIKASLAVNTELIKLYWEMGKVISEKQKQYNWGSKFIEKLANDLQNEFPGMKGFSYRNIKYIKQFYKSYQSVTIGQAVLAQLPWYHNIALLDKLKNNQERLWYAQQAVKNGWSRNVLVHQIESALYHRQVISEKTTNFKITLPQPQSDLAHELLKDSYTFGFLSMEEDVKERELQKQLVRHIRKFLLELGAGFAFVGEQYHLNGGDEDYYLDLLFYHVKLKCYIVIELKSGKFKPEYAGKLNFYLSVIDDTLKGKDDNKSIGILLCKLKNKITVEYSLKDISKLMGISEYKLTNSVPEELRSSLPSIADIEAELEKK